MRTLALILFLGIGAGPWLHAQAANPVGPSNPTAIPSLHPSPGALRQAQDVAAAGEEDIRDIRGPVPIPSNWWFLLVACGVAAIGAAGYVGWRLWKNRRPKAAKLPHEIALDRIEAALALIDRGEADAFSTAVSGAVRSYIEQRFKLRAERETTEEFLHNVLNDPAAGLSAYSDLLREFLGHCDLAKFARWPLTAAEMRAMAESAKKFVLETRPATTGKKTASVPEREKVAA